MVFPQLIDFLISLYGWRGAYLALALLVALTILPIAAALFRDRPEKFGLTTDAGSGRSRPRQREEPSFTRKQALRTGVFWLLCAVGFLTNAVGTALLLNHFSIMQTAGIGRSDALNVLAVYAGVQVVVTLGTGALLDRYEPRRLVPLAMFLLAATTALPALGSGIAVSWLYALCLGGAYGSQQAIGAPATLSTLAVIISARSEARRLCLVLAALPSGRFPSRPASTGPERISLP